MVKDRVKLKKKLEKTSNADFWNFIFMAIIVGVIFVIWLINGNLFNGKSLGELIEVSVILSFLLAFICEIVAKYVGEHKSKKYEDLLKETTDYDFLVKKYMLDKIAQENPDKLVKLNDGKLGETIILPELILSFNKTNKPYKFKFKKDIDENGDIAIYKIPGELEKYYDVLIHAHRGSNIYNNQHIRIDDFKEENNVVSINYSLTTYFDSLMTNRAVDYPLNDILTVREMYEPGPFINELRNSKLSNHLGFNGIIEIDDKYIFIKRCKNVSIGKDLWQTSTNSSYKIKYGLDLDKNLSSEYLSKAIKGEIKDELKFNINENVDMSKSIFAFYRDLVEGGKPQFLYYFKIDIKKPNCSIDGKYITSIDDFIAHFKNQIKEEDFNRDMTIDGNIIEFIPKTDFENARYGYDKICFSNGRVLKMTPSNVVSVILLLKKQGKEILPM